MQASGDDEGDIICRWYKLCIAETFYVCALSFHQLYGNI